MKRTLAAWICALALGVATSAGAQGPRNQGGRDPAPREQGAREPGGAQVSRDQAAAVAQRAHGGRVLSVDRADGAWRVKVLTASGEVRVVLVDATTGRQL